MASGVSLVWVITWALWGAVVYKDWRGSLGDRRWLASLAAWLVLAAMTRGSLSELDLRAGLLIAVAVAVLGAWSLFDLVAAGRRSRKAAWCRSAGFEVVEAMPTLAAKSLPDGLRRLPMLGRGRSPQTDGLFRREDGRGREVLVFDHAIRRPVIWYDVNGIESAGTVVAIRTPGIDLPLVQVRPVGLFDWMDGGPAGDPVPSPAGSLFAKSYRLGGHEPRNLRSLFADDLLALIGGQPGWLIEGEGEWLAAVRFDRPASPMSLKTSKLRVVPAAGLAEHVREAEALLGTLSERASRASRREAGAA